MEPHTGRHVKSWSMFSCIVYYQRLWNMTSPRSVRGWSGGAKRRRQPLFTEKFFLKTLPALAPSLYCVTHLSLETVPWIRYILLSPLTHVYLKHGIFTWGYCLTWLLWTVVIYKIFGDFSRLDPFSGHFLISWFLEMEWKGAATFGKTHCGLFSCLRSRLAETQTYLRQTPTGGFGLKCKGFRYQI